MHTFMCESCNKEYALYFQSQSGWCYACHTGTTMPDGSVLCHTCNGYGKWIGGTIVNGYPTMSRKCNCCAGKGYQTKADVARDNAYHNHADGAAALADLRYTTPEIQLYLLENDTWMCSACHEAYCASFGDYDIPIHMAVHVQWNDTMDPDAHCSCGFKPNNKKNEEEKEVNKMNLNKYGVPVSDKGVACGTCSYWEDGHKHIQYHATVAQVKLCSHRHNEAKAAASAQ